MIKTLDGLGVKMRLLYSFVMLERSEASVSIPAGYGFFTPFRMTVQIADD
jgi:hypothetical protein